MTRELLTAVRTEGASVESEPVLVERDGAVVTLRLDDGATLEFDAVELLSAAALERAA